MTCVHGFWRRRWQSPQGLRLSPQRPAGQHDQCRGVWIKDNNGNIRCGLFISASTFPKDEQKFQGVEAPIANGQSTCTFTNVAPGTYAVAYYKAAPGQTKMNTGMFGSPADPYGFSRNATIGMGPPSFNSAAYSYAGGNTTWPVTITYP